MLRIRLKELLDERRAGGERITYQSLARDTGLSRATLESLASRDGYNTRLSTVEKLCRALRCQPGDILELITDTDRKPQ